MLNGSPTRGSTLPRRGRLDPLFSSAPLTVVHGARGSGKTAAVASWARSTEVDGMWIDIAGGGQEPDAVWARLAGRLRARNVSGSAADPPSSPVLRHEVERLLGGPLSGFRARGRRRPRASRRPAALGPHRSHRTSPPRRRRPPRRLPLDRHRVGGAARLDGRRGRRRARVRGGVGLSRRGVLGRRRDRRSPAPRRRGLSRSERSAAPGRPPIRRAGRSRDRCGRMRRAERRGRGPRRRPPDRAGRLAPDRHEP